MGRKYKEPIQDEKTQVMWTYMEDGLDKNKRKIQKGGGKKNQRKTTKMKIRQCLRTFLYTH